jgi:hypothetical protein
MFLLRSISYFSFKKEVLKNNPNRVLHLTTAAAKKKRGASKSIFRFRIKHELIPSLMILSHSHNTYFTAHRVESIGIMMATTFGRILLTLLLMQ